MSLSASKKILSQRRHSHYQRHKTKILASFQRFYVPFRYHLLSFHSLPLFTTLISLLFLHFPSFNSFHVPIQFVLFNTPLLLFLSNSAKSYSSCFSPGFYAGPFPQPPPPTRPRTANRFHPEARVT